MTQLHVEKKNSNGWVWIILILILLGLLAYWYFNRQNGRNEPPLTTDTLQSDQSVVAATQADFSSVDFDAPEHRLDEITDASIIVRENDQYSIYDLGNNILFAKGESTLKADSKNKLDAIAQSIKQRYSGKKIAIFGNADSDGSEPMNDDLAKSRAESVKEYLVNKSNIDAGSITTKSFGENKPVATNDGAEGKQLNRNVQIVVIK